MSKVVIYGTQSMGISIAQMLMSSTEQQYKVVGFLNDETNATNKYILGLPVFSTTDKDIMLDNLKKNHVESIIVSPLKIKELDRYNAFDIFIENNIHILVLPNISKMEDIVSKVDVEKNLRNIQIDISFTQPKMIILYVFKDYVKLLLIKILNILEAELEKKLLMMSTHYKSHHQRKDD